MRSYPLAQQWPTVYLLTLISAKELDKLQGHLLSKREWDNKKVTLKIKVLRLQHTFVAFVCKPGEKAPYIPYVYFEADLRHQLTYRIIEQ